MIATYRIFCNPVDHFAETFRSLWFLFLQSNESRDLVFVMLANKIRRISRIMITRQELIRGTMPCRGARNAHGSFSIRSPPSKFYLQVIATEIGRKSTSRHKSQIRISGLWPQRIYITSRNVRVLMRDATADQRLSQRAAFDSCWCCTKKRWTINHGWLQRTQIQTTISEKYSLGHTEQIQISAANKS